jgi:predicted metalloprotease
MFNRNVNLDPSQVSDRRGGGGFGRGGGVAIGGGAGVLILLLSMLLGINPGDLTGGGADTGYYPQEEAVGGRTVDRSLAQECQVGQDANEREDCRVVGFVNSIQAYWTDEFARRGGRYPLAKTTLYEQMVQTGCGTAPARVGPFYCPNDQNVYIDLSFFQELQHRYGARGGPFAQAYVLAHEYGHHIQGLTGVLDQAHEGDRGPQSSAVRVELQADCYAGVWAHHAVATGYIERLTDSDIADGLSAAAAVGDDALQRRGQGYVNPEKWTHGSSEQRVRWFKQGYESGNPDACDTFSGRV